MENQNNMIDSDQNKSLEDSTLLNNLQIERLQEFLKLAYHIRYDKNLDPHNFKLEKASLPDEINMYSILVFGQIPFIILPGKKNGLLIQNINADKIKWVQCLVNKKPFKKGNFYILKISQYSDGFSLEKLLQEHVKLRESNIAIGEPIYSPKKFLSLRFRQPTQYLKSWNKLKLFCSKQLELEMIKQKDKQKEEWANSKFKMELSFIINTPVTQSKEENSNNETTPSLKKNKIELN